MLPQIMLITSKSCSRRRKCTNLVTVAQAVPASDGTDTAATVAVHDVSATTLPPRVCRDTNLRDTLHGVYTAGLAKTRDVAWVAHVALGVTVGSGEDVGWGRCWARSAVLLAGRLRGWARAGA
jgi:hypothetical protein